MISYFKFILKSTNHHGVHSPFVYKYITKGLYLPTSLHIKQKSHLWLIRSINYFKDLTFIDNNYLELPYLNVTLTKHASLANTIVLHYQPQQSEVVKQYIVNLTSTQIMLLTFTDYPIKFLNSLRNDHSITLVVDCYYGCLISKRTTQPKQNFYIRF